MNYELPGDIQQRIDYLLQTDNMNEATELRDAYLYLNSVVDLDEEIEDYDTINTLDHPAFLERYNPCDSMGLLH